MVPSWGEVRSIVTAWVGAAHIPKAKSTAFSFEGRELSAHHGEVIASALFAHGIKTFGLHPDDKTPQGIFCANGQCAQCMVVADGRPVKACMTSVQPGMQVQPLVNVPRMPELDREAIDFTEIEERACDLLIIGAGPWAGEFWEMLGLPDRVDVKAGMARSMKASGCGPTGASRKGPWV